MRLAGFYCLLSVAENSAIMFGLLVPILALLISHKLLKCASVLRSHHSEVCSPGESKRYARGRSPPTMDPYSVLMAVATRRMLKWFPVFNRGYHNAQSAWGFIRPPLIVTVINVIVVLLLAVVRRCSAIVNCPCSK